MDFLYVPTQYSSEVYSSFVDNETSNNVPGLSHSSDSSSRCSTPKSLDRTWETDSSAANSLAEGSFWNPPPSYEVQIDTGMHASQPAYQHIDPFGGRTGPHCSGDSLQGASFDSLLKGIEFQSYSDVFSYAPAYEPLSWSPPQLPNANTWPETSLSSDFPLAAPRPVHAARTDALQSFEAYTYPSGVSHRQLASSSPIPIHISSIRYNPLANRRDAPKSTAARSRSGSNDSTHQHQCSACSCRFARSRDLTRHFRLHTGERPYECAGCSERFIRVDARKRHWGSRPECKVAHDRLTL